MAERKQLDYLMEIARGKSEGVKEITKSSWLDESEGVKEVPQFSWPDAVEDLKSLISYDNLASLILTRFLVNTSLHTCGLLILGMYRT